MAKFRRCAAAVVAICAMGLVTAAPAQAADTSWGYHIKTSQN